MTVRLQIPDRFRSKSGSYLLEGAVLLPVIIVISMMLLMLILFLFGNTQDAALLGVQVRRAAGEASQTVQYDVQRDMRIFSLSGRYRNERNESEVSERRNGAVSVFTADTVRKGRFLSLFPFEAESRSKSVWTSLEEAHLVRTADLVFETIDEVTG